MNDYVIGFPREVLEEVDRQDIEAALDGAEIKPGCLIMIVSRSCSNCAHSVLNRPDGEICRRSHCTNTRKGRLSGWEKIPEVQNGKN